MGLIFVMIICLLVFIATDGSKSDDPFSKRLNLKYEKINSNIVNIYNI